MDQGITTVLKVTSFGFFRQPGRIPNLGYKNKKIKILRSTYAYWEHYVTLLAKFENIYRYLHMIPIFEVIE